MCFDSHISRGLVPHRRFLLKLPDAGHLSAPRQTVRQTKGAEDDAFAATS
jgi:hypothetical protein